MIIDGKECYLCDDGTLDTVIEVEGREHRWTDTSFYRDENGILTENGFIELCQEAIESDY